MNKETIIKNSKHFNQKYADSGFTLVSLFGSYARDTFDVFSDIDLTYKIDHDRFYKDDAFAKLAQIEAYKKEIEETLHKHVDLIPANTKNYLLKEQLEQEQVFI